MIDPPPIVHAPPAGVDPELWSGLNEGERLRWLKEQQFELHLSREEFLQLARVPFWAMYGPEHGLPEEMFNPQGFLLPKYRPGGGRYPMFREWRRRYRSASWLQHLSGRRLRRFFLGKGVLVEIAWITAGLALGTVLAPFLHHRYPQVPAEVWKWGTILGHIFVLGTVVGIAGALVVRRCILRAVYRRYPLPKADP